VDCSYSADTQLVYEQVQWTILASATSMINIHLILSCN